MRKGKILSNTMQSLWVGVEKGGAINKGNGPSAVKLMRTCHMCFRP